MPLVGREAIIEQISRDALDPNGRPITAIVGISGIGKTAVVTEIVFQTIPKFLFEKIVWVPYSLLIHGIEKERSSAKLWQNLKETLKNQLLDRSASPVIDNLIRYRFLEKPYLIVIDGVEDVLPQEVLENLYKCCRPTLVLITSQVQQNAIIVNNIQMPPLNQSQTKLLLSQTAFSEGIEEEAFQKIYESIGGHPQLILMVAGLLKSFPPTQALDSLATFSKQKPDIRIFNLFSQIWDKIGADSRILLAQIVKFSKDGMPFEQIQANSRLKKSRLLTAIKNLIDFSLLDRNVGGNERYYFHQIVAMLVDQMSPERPDETAVLNNLEFWQKIIEQIDSNQFEKILPNLHLINHGVTVALEDPTAIKKTTDLLLALFSIIERVGHLEVWIPHFETICNTHLHRIEKYIQVKLLNRLGQLQKLDYKFDQALESHQRAEKIAKQLEDDQLLAESWFNLSTNYYEINQLSEAQLLINQAIAIFKLAPQNPKWIATAFNTKGLIGLANNEVEASIEAFQKSIQYWKRTSDLTELARVYKNLGYAYQLMADPIASEKAYFEAVSIFRKTTSAIDLAQLYLNLSALYYQQNVPQKALNMLRKIDPKLFSTAGNLYLDGVFNQNLGNCLLAVRNFDEATIHLKKAIKIWKILDRPIDLANSIGTLGEVWSAIGEFEQATEAFNEAIIYVTPFTHEERGERILNFLFNEREKIKQ